MRTFGLAPSEFWSMPPRHFWWLVDAEQSQREADAGVLSEEDKRELYTLLIEADRA